MAITVGELEAKLHLDVRDFVAGIKSAEKVFTSSGDDFAKSAKRTSEQVGTHFSSIGKSAQKAGGFIKSALTIAGGVAAFNVLSAGAGTLKNFASEAVMASARAEQLSRVLYMMGKNAGISKDVINEQIKGIRSMGIELGVAQNTLQNFIRYQLDATQATKLARVAQDAAIMENVNSSQSLDRLIWGIQTQNTQIFRTAGLMVNVGASLDAYARKVGKTTADLSSNERVQATLNAVLKEGVKIQGAYTTSLDSPLKMLGSMERVVNDIQINIGNALLPAFTSLIKEGLVPFLTSMKQMTASGGSLSKFFANLGEILTNITKAFFGVIPTLVSLGTAFMTFFAPLLLTFGALIKVVGASQTALMALGGIMVLLALRSKLMGIEMVGSTVKMGMARRMAMYYSATLQAGGTQMQAFGIVTQSMKMGFVAAMATMKAAALSLVSMLAPMLIITAIAMAFTAFQKRQQQAKEAAERLTKAVKEQFTTLKALGTLADGLAKKGVRTVGDVMLASAKDGEKLAASMNYLGKKTTDYASEVLKLKQAGGTFKYLEKELGNFQRAGDTFYSVDYKGRFTEFSASANEAAIQLSYLADEMNRLDTTDTVNAIIQQASAIDDAAARAKKYVDIKKEENETLDKGLDKNALALKYYQMWSDMYKRLSVETNTATASTKNFYSSIKMLQTGMEEGELTADKFINQISSIDSKQSKANRAYFDLSLQLGAVQKSMKATKGDSVAFTQAGYAMQDMVASAGAEILNLGGSAGDAGYAMKAIIDNFYASAKSAGFTKEKVDLLVESLGLMDAYKEITITFKAQIGEVEAAIKTYIAAQALMGNDKDATYIRRIQTFEEKIAEIKATEKASKKVFTGKITPTTTKDTKSATEVDHSFSKAKEVVQEFAKTLRTVLENKVNSAADALQKLKDKAQEFSNTIHSSFDGMVNASDALSSSQDLIVKATEISNKELEAQEQKILDAVSAYQEYGNAVANVSRGIFSFATASETAGKSSAKFLKNLTKQVQQQKDYGKLITDLQGAGMSKEALAQFQTLGIKVGTKLGKSMLAGGVDEIGKYNDLVKESESLAQELGKSVTNKFYLEGYDASVQMMFAMEKGIKDSMPNVLAELVKQAETTTKFGDKIRELATAGITSPLLDQVMGAGAEAGTKIADSLLGSISTGATTAEKLNELASTGTTVADALAKELNLKFYDAGITAAQALYDGLVAALKKFDFSIGNLTDNATMDDIKKIGENAGLSGKEIAGGEKEAKDNIVGNFGPGSNKNVLQDMKDTGLTVEQWKALDALIKKNASMAALGGVASKNSTSKKKVKKKAMGGSVMAGAEYLIGEKGPELFRPSVGGSIVSNNDLSSRSSGSGSAPISISVNVQGSVTSERDLVTAIHRGLNDLKRRQGNLKLV